MARTKEKDEKRAVLRSVALDDTRKAKVAARDKPGDPGRQIWRTPTQKHIVDFSAWETGGFDSAFQKLIRGLRQYYAPADPPATPDADAAGAP
jgi:hypothetical protein